MVLISEEKLTSFRRFMKPLVTRSLLPLLPHVPAPPATSCPLARVLGTHWLCVECWVLTCHGLTLLRSPSAERLLWNSEP